MGKLLLPDGSAPEIEASCRTTAWCVPMAAGGGCNADHCAALMVAAVRFAMRGVPMTHVPLQCVLTMAYANCSHRIATSLAS